MRKSKVERYFRKISEFSDKEFLYATIVYNAAPTIAQKKPSSLLVFKNNSRKLKDTWLECRNKMRENSNTEFFELNKNDDLIVVLIYNKEFLKETLDEKRNAHFLRRFGYNDSMNLKQKLELLGSRYSKACPHEIGIFLGYPVQDVAVFTHCPNKKCLITGYWKVYNNIEQARETFDKYDFIKENVVNLINNGFNPVEIIDKKLLKVA